MPRVRTTALIRNVVRRSTKSDKKPTNSVAKADRIKLVAIKIPLAKDLFSCAFSMIVARMTGVIEIEKNPSNTNSGIWMVLEERTNNTNKIGVVINEMISIFLRPNLSLSVPAK